MTPEQLAKIKGIQDNWFILCDLLYERDPSDYLTTDDFKYLTYASLTTSQISPILELSDIAYQNIIQTGDKISALVEKLEAEDEDYEAEDDYEDED